VSDLIISIDPNHDGTISKDEFKAIMKHIEE
jgi:Ca2+-binding EF-hand superfamily protein